MRTGTKLPKSVPNWHTILEIGGPQLAQNCRNRSPTGTACSEYERAQSLFALWGANWHRIFENGSQLAQSFPGENQQKRRSLGLGVFSPRRPERIQGLGDGSPALWRRTLGLDLSVSPPRPRNQGGRWMSALGSRNFEACDSRGLLGLLRPRGPSGVWCTRMVFPRTHRELFKMIVRFRALLHPRRPRRRSSNRRVVDG